jgi:hypothetical protein
MKQEESNELALQSLAFDKVCIDGIILPLTKMEIQTKHELVKRKERKARLAEAAEEAWKIGMTLEEYDKHLEQ